MHMANRLLDRQASLLDCLSSAATILGGEADAPAGIDREVLRLQARFICNKRMEKIVTIFPRTLRILGARQKSVLRDFVEASRPTQRGSLANAREFHEFLTTRWRSAAPEPAYLPDVAACELARAQARDVPEERTNDRASESGTPQLRRRRSVVPLRCAYDVRGFFDAWPQEVVPPKRDISLVVSLPPGGRELKLMEVTSPTVDALSLLADWADPSVLDAFGERAGLLADLTAHGLVEERD